MLHKIRAANPGKRLLIVLDNAPYNHADAVTRAAKKKGLTPTALRCLYAQDSTGWKVVATTFPIPATTLRRRRGARVITLARDLVRALPQHKLTSYAVSMIGLRQAIDADADEGLFVDRRGRVLEGTTTNVFAIDGETLITARDAILPGIVRAWVIENASRVLYRPPAGCRPTARSSPPRISRRTAAI